MAQTQLTGRGIVMVLLGMIAVLGGMALAMFIFLPPPEVEANPLKPIVITAFITLVAGAWFVRLMIAAIRDRARGVEREPVKLRGWFHIWLGAFIAAGGIIASVLEYESAGLSHDRSWNIYWGMVAWGLLQMLLGAYKLRHRKFHVGMEAGRLAQAATRVYRK
jgi:hypothetical protein